MFMYYLVHSKLFQKCIDWIEQIVKVRSCRFCLPHLRRATQGVGEASPCPFLKINKSVLNFEKKSPNLVHPWVKISIQNVVLRVSRRKSSFLCFLQNVHSSALIPQNLFCPEKFLVARLCLPSYWTYQQMLKSLANFYPASYALNLWCYWTFIPPYWWFWHRISWWL